MLFKKFLYIFATEILNYNFYIMRKRIYFLLVLALVSLVSFAQPKIGFPFGEYTKTDSIVLEWAWVNIQREIPENENVKNCGGGYYMFKLQHPRYIIVRTNEDRTKAFIDNFHPMFLSREYNVFEDERSLVLWYEDDNIYCGFVYNKQAKACDRFAKRKKQFMKEFKRFFKPRK